MPIKDTDIELLLEKRGEPDPAFMGDFLAYNFLPSNQFGLSTYDLDNIVAPLPETLRKLAQYWIILYLCWVFGVTLRTKYGNDFFETSLQAVYARFAALEETSNFGNVLRYYFKMFDDAAANVGQAVVQTQSVEIPPEYFIALSLLAASPDSPFFRKTEFFDRINDIALDLVAVLKTSKESVLSLIHLTVNAGGPIDEKVVLKSNKQPVNGVVCSYHNNGNIKSEVTYKDGKREGLLRTYYKSGKLFGEAYAKDNKLEGIVKNYYESGKIKTEVTYENDKREGIEKVYSESGKLESETPYKNGVIDRGKIVMKYCSMCGSQCVDNARYCEKCGHEFTVMQSTTEPQRTSANYDDDLRVNKETLWKYKHKTPPTQWLKFWTYFRLPFGLLISIGSLYDLSGFSASEREVVIIVFMVILIATIAAIAGLHLRQLWGWKLNWVVLVSECISYPLIKAENINETELLGFLMIGWIIMGLAWGLPNYIYFKKRRVLFE